MYAYFRKIITAAAIAIAPLSTAIAQTNQAAVDTAPRTAHAEYSPLPDYPDPTVACRAFGKEIVGDFTNADRDNLTNGCIERAQWGYNQAKHFWLSLSDASKQQCVDLVSSGYHTQDLYPALGDCAENAFQTQWPLPTPYQWPPQTFTKW